MDLGLAGKRAVVTGGSRGIGLAIASALAAEGADIALLARDPGRLEAARQRLSESGRRILALSADTTDDTAVRAAIDHTARELGGVDILVNSAAEPAAPARPAPWPIWSTTTCWRRSTPRSWATCAAPAPPRPT